MKKIFLLFFFLVFLNISYAELVDNLIIRLPLTYNSSDVIGNNHYNSVIGSITFSNSSGAFFDGGAYLNKTSGYSLFYPYNNFSFCININTTSTAIEGIYMEEYYALEQNIDFFYFISNGAYDAYFEGGGVGGIILNDSTISLNVVNKICINYANRTYAEIYLNGVLLSTGIFGLSTFTPNRNTIGYRHNLGAFNGNLKEFCGWGNKTLTSLEVLQYNATGCINTTPPLAPPEFVINTNLINETLIEKSLIQNICFNATFSGSFTSTFGNCSLYADNIINYTLYNINLSQNNCINYTYDCLTESKNFLFNCTTTDINRVSSKYYYIIDILNYCLNTAIKIINDYIVNMQNDTTNININTINIWGELKMIPVIIINIIFFLICVWFSENIHKKLIILSIIPLINVTSQLLNLFDVTNSELYKIINTFSTLGFIVISIIIGIIYLMLPKETMKDNRDIYSDMKYK